MRVDLVDLRLFRDAVEAGSITHGAEKSGIALAAASTRIRNMELAFGTTLLKRSRQGVAVTEAGRTLLAHARNLLNEAERMREDLNAFATGSAGQVRLLSNTNALTEFLPSALSRFLAAHKGVSIDLEERLSNEIIGLIAEGAADVGIVAGTDDTGTLQTFPFRSDRFVLVTAKTHPFARRRTIAFADLFDSDFVGLDRRSALQRFLAGQASRQGRTLRLRVQLRSFDAVCRLVESGVGIGIVPQTTAKRAQQTMAIGVVPLTDKWAERQLTICVRKMSALTPLAHALVEHLRVAD